MTPALKRKQKQRHASLRSARRQERDEKQVAVWLKGEIKDALKATAAREGKSQGAVIEAALAVYLASPTTDAQPT